MTSSIKPGSPIIVALDYPSADETLALVDRLDPDLCRLKVGKELFTRCGPALVKTLVDRGYDVFLDLKFHDIPNTTAAAVSAACDLGVWMVDVHAMGGEAMMCAAREAIGSSQTLLIGVTVLTSMNAEDLYAVGIQIEPERQVLRLARLAAECGLDGVVCSSMEAAMLREAQGENFVLVTPGIRPRGDAAGDQKRIVTPAQAIANGSSYLVIGRPVTRAADPVSKLQDIAAEISGKI